RDVGEHHATAFADEGNGTESDQPVAGADVEHDVALLDRSALEHAVANGPEELERMRGGLGVAEPPLEDPRGPAVAHPASASSAWRSSGRLTIATPFPSGAIGHSSRGRSR